MLFWEVNRSFALVAFRQISTVTALVAPWVQDHFSLSSLWQADTSDPSLSLSSSLAAPSLAPKTNEAGKRAKKSWRSTPEKNGKRKRDWKKHRKIKERKSFKIKHPSRTNSIVLYKTCECKLNVKLGAISDVIIKEKA